MRVLVIDDSELARAQLRELLTDAGMEVFEQPSAIGATRALIQNDIDAALIDVTMPGLSGDKLVGVLRRNARLDGLLIILISARSWEELRAVADHSGADALLPKEQVGTELVKLLQRLGPISSGRRHGQRKNVCVK